MTATAHRNAVFGTTPAVVVGATFAAVAGVATVGLVAPDGTDPYPVCPFHALTGWDCPGCGTLRAVHALTRGDLLAAADLNLLVVVLAPVVVWGWLTLVRHALAPQRHRRPAPRLPTWLGPAVVVALPLWWVARNLPGLAFLGTG